MSRVVSVISVAVSAWEGNLERHQKYALGFRKSDFTNIQGNTLMTQILGHDWENENWNTSKMKLMICDQKLPQ